MKKTILGLFLLAGVLFGAPSAKAEIVTSTPTLVSLPLKAAQTNGIVVKSCVFNAGAAANTFYVYDGTTLKAKVSVSTVSTLTVDFAVLFKEEFKLAGAFNVKSSVEDALGQVTCAIALKRAN